MKRKKKSKTPEKKKKIERKILTVKLTVFIHAYLAFTDQTILLSVVIYKNISMTTVFSGKYVTVSVADWMA